MYLFFGRGRSQWCFVRHFARSTVKEMLYTTRRICMDNGAREESLCIHLPLPHYSDLNRIYLEFRPVDSLLNDEVNANGHVDASRLQNFKHSISKIIGYFT